MTARRKSTRRHFLAAAAAAVAAPYVVPARAFGANDRVNIGYIGCGRRADGLRGVPGGAHVIALADVARDTAAAAVAALHESGIEVVMLTGDNQATARAVAASLGIEVRAELLPAAGLSSTTCRVSSGCAAALRSTTAKGTVFAATCRPAGRYSTLLRSATCRTQVRPGS